MHSVHTKFTAAPGSYAGGERIGIVGVSFCACLIYTKKVRTARALIRKCDPIDTSYLFLDSHSTLSAIALGLRFSKVRK